jgi:hypothetical protein
MQKLSQTAFAAVGNKRPAKGAGPADRYFFACPRAKMLATKLRTSVEHTSQ